MASELVVFENALKPLAPRFEQALAGAIPVERLMRSIMVSVERTPKLLQCDRQSLLNASMSAACLALEVDGVTGQAFFVPFAGKAQLIIGYKGMNTLAARSGFTVQGEVVREGDFFDYELGDRGFVKHKPKLGARGPILAAWATASSLHRPAIVSVLGIDELMAIKEKSPGAKMSDSPWNNPAIGFPAMCAKSAKRRLNRAMPLNADPRFALAAAMEENFEERGKHSWISPDKGVVIDGEFSDAPQINHEQRGTAELLTTPLRQQGTRHAAETAAPGSAPHAGGDQDGAAGSIPTAADYFSQWETMIQGATSPDQIKKAWNDQTALRKSIAWTDEHTFNGLQAKVKRAIDFLQPARS